MTIVNPYAANNAQGSAFEQGWLAGYAEPNDEHAPPLADDLIGIYHDGEAGGRADRQSEWSQSGSMPGQPADGFDRFESAPNGVLIPIPDSFGELEIRSDAQVQVSPYNNGYYVAIYNVGPEGSGDWFATVLQEIAQHRLEELIAEAAKIGSTRLLKFGGLAVTVIMFLLESTPVLNELRFRGYLPDGTSVSYVVLCAG